MKRSWQDIESTFQEEQRDVRFREHRQRIHDHCFVPLFDSWFLETYLELCSFRGSNVTHYFNVPLYAKTTGRIVLYSPTCVVTNIHLSHKKKDAATVRYRPDGLSPEEQASLILPSFATHEHDCTLFLLPPTDKTSKLFHHMPSILEELDALFESTNCPDRFSKTSVCWNKKRCDQMIVYNSKNIVNYQLSVPVPRSLFVPPPAKVLEALSSSLFANGDMPPPVLHWSIYSMKEGKLFGLNFDWQDCYMTPTVLSASAAGGGGGEEEAAVPGEDDDDDEEELGLGVEEGGEEKQAQEFHKLTDAKYAVVMMMSNYRRVIKFYFHPSLVPATADPTRKKRICSTIRFELTNGQCMVIPQETKVCVTASQVSNEIFSGKKQKKDFPKTFYFFVMFVGPRVS